MNLQGKGNDTKGTLTWAEKTTEEACTSHPPHGRSQIGERLLGV